MGTWIKKNRLIAQSKIDKMKKRISMLLGRLLFLISISMFLLIFLTNIFHRVPVFSYFVRELKLPLTLKLCGQIQVNFEDEIEPNTMITISIGGYKNHVRNGTEFELNYSAVNLQNIPVIIEFWKQEKKITKIEYITYQKGEYVLECSYTYYE